MKIEINTRHQHTTKSLKPNFQGLIKRAQYQFAKREIEDILQMKLRLSENIIDAFEKQIAKDKANQWAQNRLDRLKKEYEINKKSPLNNFIQKIKKRFK